MQSNSNEAQLLRMPSNVYIWIKLLVMLIIGIAGGTGCGKTTVVNQIVEQLPKDEVVVISQDDCIRLKGF